MYDYWLGGKDNYEADRLAAEAVREQRPDVAELALENKKFLSRAIEFVAGQGVDQFLDIGSGLPTSPVRDSGAQPEWLSTHLAARSALPAALVAYVDYDQVAVMHSQALLAKGSKGVIAVRGDMREPATILGSDALLDLGIDLSRPACVIFGCVLHFVDPAQARRIVAEFSAALAPGSYVVATVGYDGDEGDFAGTYNAQAGPTVYRQTRGGVQALLDDLEVLSPGIVDARTWRPGWQETARPQRGACILAAVARRP